MGQIIQPLGPVIGQILIEMDARGTTKISANHLVFGKQVPIVPMELVTILSQVVSSTLLALNKSKGKIDAKTEDTASDHS